MPCTFDLNAIVDPSMNTSLGMELGEYSGKLQQTVTGNLVRHGYNVEVVGEMDTCCVCCFTAPRVFTPLEVTAP